MASLVCPTNKLCVWKFPFKSISNTTPYQSLARSDVSAQSSIRKDMDIIWCAIYHGGSFWSHIFFFTSTNEVRINGIIREWNVNINTNTSSSRQNKQNQSTANVEFLFTSHTHTHRHSLAAVCRLQTAHCFERLQLIWSPIKLVTFRNSFNLFMSSARKQSPMQWNRTMFIIILLVSMNASNDNWQQ